MLAYGQTGSGKTYTMGTGLDIAGNPHERGIIPRAVDHLFDGVKQRQAEAHAAGKPVPDFKVNAQFLELYNEEIIDLLSEERTKQSQIRIREDADGGMYLMGSTTKPVTSVMEALACLKQGALSRTTGSTQMNAQSSRSHAIFTLHIKQVRVAELPGDDKENNQNADVQPEFETLTAKFHFVDLAGSERLKRTGATGDRAKEGISINSGLLALGNVISALGDTSKRAQHVPYRDSKLTRMLQDSLGGNSRTLMIACISPSDRDFMETLNTLRYANRAKNIKNRVVANQDKQSQLIGALRRQIQELELELREYKQGKRVMAEDGQEHVNDMYHENTMLQAEIANLRTRVKALQETNARLSERNALLLTEREAGGWVHVDGEKSDMSDIVQKYLTEIEELRTRLIEAEETCSQLRKQAQRSRVSMQSPYANNAVAIAGSYDIRETPENDLSSADLLIREARKEVEREKKQVNLFANGRHENGVEGQDTNGNELDEPQADEEPAEENSSDESDEEEEADAAKKNQAELALLQLTNEISTKEKLIQELERSQRKISSLKQHYEDKLVMLQQKINEIENERDKVLLKLSAAGNSTNEKTAKVREEYQKKLNMVQTEMKKLQAAKIKHEKTLKSQVQYEQQLKQLRNEVDEMKRAKVRLVTQMKEEQQRHREQDLRNHKRIAQLSKQDRLKDVKIKALEGEQRRFKQLLKRKDDEVIALKRRPPRAMSDKVAGRVPGSSRQAVAVVKPLPFSPKASKQRWTKLEENINKQVIASQNIRVQHAQMENYLFQRDQDHKTLENLHNKYKAAQKQKDDSLIAQLAEEIDNIEEHIRFLNQSIADCQSAILQLEESKDDSEGNDLGSFIQTASMPEIKYIFDKIIAMTINKAMESMQLEEERREYELKFKQLSDTSMVQEELLHHVLETTFIGGMDELMPWASDDHLNDVQEPRKTLMGKLDMRPPTSPAVTRKSDKARRQTKTPQELLFETSSKCVAVCLMNHKPDAYITQMIRYLNCCSIKPPRREMPRYEDPMTQSLMGPASFGMNDLHRVPSAPSLK